MESENHGREKTGPAEENNHTEKQAAAVSGEPLCIDRSPGAKSGAGQEDEGKPVTGAEPAVPEEITELEWMRRHVRTGKKGRLREQAVFRKTDLHDRPSSVFRTRTAGKKQRVVHHPGESEFQVPEEMQEFAESLIGHLNGSSEDLYLQIALVDEQVGELDKMFRKTTRQFERRIAEPEERGRWT